MAKAEGLVLPFDDVEHINTSILEIFEYKGARQQITYETKEFSAVCPFSGLPDYGLFRMDYIPNAHCVELKSLKYYLISYRNIGIYQEAATHHLFTDIHALLSPQHLKITTQYYTRGGIDTTCLIEKGDKNHLISS